MVLHSRKENSSHLPPRLSPVRLMVTNILFSTGPRLTLLNAIFFIIIIIITGQTALIEPQPRRRLCPIASRCHFLGFLDNQLIADQGLQPRIEPKPAGSGLCTYVSQWHDNQVIPTRNRVRLLSPSATRTTTVNVLLHASICGEMRYHKYILGVSNW
jgi:hypothetical protein